MTRKRLRPPPLELSDSSSKCPKVIDRHGVTILVEIRTCRRRPCPQAPPRLGNNPPPRTVTAPARSARTHGSPRLWSHRRVARLLQLEKRNPAAPAADTWLHSTDPC